VKSPHLERVKDGLQHRDVDAILSAFADPFVFEDVPSGQKMVSQEDLRSYFQTLFALSDIAFTDLRMYETETFAVLEWTWSVKKGSSGGGYQVRGASVIELRNGRIARETMYYAPRPTLT
jgi:ketosteroid isomerase-like protein